MYDFVTLPSGALGKWTRVDYKALAEAVCCSLALGSEAYEMIKACTSNDKYILKLSILTVKVTDEVRGLGGVGVSNFKLIWVDNLNLVVR